MRRIEVAEPSTPVHRSGARFALLLSFFSFESPPGGLSLFDVDQTEHSCRDGTLFDKDTGSFVS